MKLTDRLTPETDRNTWDADLGYMAVRADIARSLEQRLAHAVEALKLVTKADTLIQARYVARLALSEIESAK